MADEAMLKDWEKQATEGERMEWALEGGRLELLEDQVFKPIEQEAFSWIKSDDFDPTDPRQAFQFSALCKSVDFIRRRIKFKISKGKEARENLKQYYSTEKGE